MTGRAARLYRRVHLESAPPPRLLLEVFSHLDQDLEAARRAIAALHVPAKARAIDHALALLGQLEAALDHQAAPALCRDLAASYAFCKQRLLLASARLDPAPLEDVARVLGPIRQAFEQVIERPPPP